jgi:hypothetical protein
MRNLLSVAAKALLVIVALPVALLAGLFGSREKRNPDEVAAYLRNFIDGKGDDWDWDDFISVPIADQTLEAIRQRAAAVELPLTDRGMATLRELLGETEHLAAGH